MRSDAVVLSPVGSACVPVGWLWLRLGSLGGITRSCRSSSTTTNESSRCHQAAKTSSTFYGLACHLHSPRASRRYLSDRRLHPATKPSANFARVHPTSPYSLPPQQHLLL